MANEAQYLYSIAARDILQQAARSASAEAQLAVKEFTKVFSRAVYRDRHIRIKTLFSAAAAEASSSMVRAYRDRPNKTRSSGGAGYRNEWRFSGGALLGALSSPAMYRVTETGIKFIYKPLLDQKAKQWQRLNFGAGGRGAQTPPGRHYKMKIFGQTLPGDFGLFDIGPRPGFVLPSGYWSSTYPQKSPVSWDQSRRGHDFFILGPTGGHGPVVGESTSTRGRRIGQTTRRVPTPSLGIQGSRFLDTGVGRLVTLFPVSIEKLMSEWFAEASRGGGPAFKATVVPSSSSIANANRFIAQVLQSRAANARTAGFISRLR